MKNVIHENNLFYEVSNVKFYSLVMKANTTWKFIKRLRKQTKEYVKRLKKINKYINNNSMGLVAYG